MQYTFIQLIFLFFVYSFLGWIFDMTVAAIRYGKILNRGFLNGPLSIQYGIIMIIVLLDINDLWDYPLYQFITCMVIVFMTEYASGAILKRITGRRFWDYSDMKLNVGGYTCAFSVLGWGFTAAVTVWLINPLVCIVYSLIPVNVVKVLEIIAIAVFLIDLFVTAATMLKWHYAGGIYGNVADTLKKTKSTLGRKTYEIISRRMYKAFPELVGQEINDEVGFGRTKDRIFAKGLCIDKLVWIFFVSALIGDWVETVFVWATSGVFMSRSSLIYGTFSIVWGLGCAMFTALLYKYKEKSDRYIFMLGTVLGGAYEYACSIFTELVFGTVFWDYSKLPFNLGGRINLLFCFFWGIAAVVWLKIIYPKLSNLIEKIPIKTGNILTWILILFMIFNAGMSTLALNRYNQRQQGSLQKTPQMTAAVEDSRTDLEKFLDKHFPDKRMEQIYPNAKTVVDGKPVSQKDMKEKRKSS